MTTDAPSFDDYRDFIKQRLEKLRAENPIFSFQYCARKLKTSKSYLKLVVEKQRHITMTKITALSDLLKLSMEEQQYLVFMYLRDVANDEQLQTYFSGILRSLQSNAVHRSRSVATSSDDTEQLFSHWLKMAIHSLANVQGFQADAAWICQRLGYAHVAEDQVTQALDDLLQMGALQLSEEGVKAGPFVMRTLNSFDHDRYHVYHVGIEKFQGIIASRHAGMPRGHVMMTISLSDENAQRALDAFFRLRDELIALSKEPQNKRHVLFVSNNLCNLVVDPA